MKNKKLLTALVSIIMGGTLIGGGISMSACKKKNDDDGDTAKHHLSDSYGKDDKNHWRECTDDGCDLIFEVTPHDFTNGDCICGQSKPVTDDEKDPSDDEKDPSDDEKDPSDETKYDLVTTTWDAAAAAQTYGSADKTSQDITIGKFKFATGVYFKDGGVNTQGKDVTVTLSGVSNTLYFKGRGQSSSAVTQYSLFKDGTDVTPANWATDSKAEREFSAEDLEAGTYVIKTSASALITNLKITEKLQSGEATSIKVVTTNGAKTSFLAGEAFSAAGLQVYLVYDNGREDLLTEGYTVDDSNVVMTTAGTYEVTVKYTAKNFTVKYEITVTAVSTENALTLYTTKLNGQKPQSVQKVFKVGDTFNSANLTVYAKSESDETFLLKSDQYTVALKEGQDMSTAGEKTAVVTTTFGAKAEYKIYVLDLSAVSKTGDASVSVNKTATVGVSGNVVTVNTLTDAVKVYELLALAGNVDKPINIADGEYYENVYINLPNVHLNGSDTKKVEEGTVANGEDKNNGVVIWFDALAGGTDPANNTYGTFGSATVYVGNSASGFVANNITFKNKYNTNALFLESKDLLAQKGNSNTQAVALRVDSDRAEFYNCKMTGYHDTLFIYGGNQYYENCWIEGHTDYIFGCDSNAYFYQCKMYTLGDGSDKNGGYVVANRPDEGKAEGTHICVFNACDFDGDSQVVAGTTALGRPWGANMKMTIINSTISGKYSTAAHTVGTGQGQRYCSMGSNPVNEPKPEYMMEYNNTGAGAISASIENTCTYLSAEQAAPYAKENAKLKAILGFYPGAANLTEVYDFSTHTALGWTAAGSTGTKLFGEAIQASGEVTVYTAGAGYNMLRLKQGAVLTMQKQGSVKISWFGSYGSDSDVVITYKNGYATIKLVNNVDAHITVIVLDGSDIKADTEYTVTFNSKGGSSVSSQSVVVGEKADEPTAPTKGTDTFGGWYKDEDCLQAFDFDTETITSDITLYAKWTPAGVVECDVNIYVQGVTASIGNIKIQSGQTVTAADVNKLLAATEGYEHYGARNLYTDNTYTTEYSEAVSGETDIYITYEFIKSVTIDLTDCTTPIQTDGVFYKGIKVDAAGGGKLGNYSGGWVQFNANTTLTIYVTPGSQAVVTADIMDAGNYEINDDNISEGYITIECNSNTWIKSVTVTYRTIIDKNSTINFGSAGNYVGFEGLDQSGANYSQVQTNSTQMTSGILVFYVNPKATVSIAGNWAVWYDINGTEVKSGENGGSDGTNNSHYFENGGKITITALGAKNHFYSISISYPVIYNFGDSVNFYGSGLNIQGNSTGEYQGITIEANGGKLQDYGVDEHKVQINANTKLSFNVAEGITTENIKVTFEGKPDTAYSVTVNDGVATVIFTAGLGTGVSVMKIEEKTA